MTSKGAYHEIKTLLSIADTSCSLASRIESLYRRSIPEYRFEEGMLIALGEKHPGLESDWVRELKQLQEGNERLKRIVADVALDKDMPKAINTGEW